MKTFTLSIWSKHGTFELMDACIKIRAMDFQEASGKIYNEIYNFQRNRSPVVRIELEEIIP